MNENRTLSNSCTLRASARVARVLLVLMGMSCLFSQCVLPPPPQEETTPPDPIILNLDQIQPIGAGPLFLERELSSQEFFSVVNALVHPPSPSLKFYWFVDFDVNDPELWDSSDVDFVLKGCDEKLVDFSGADKTITVEVLITEGLLDVSLAQSDDPRFTLAGEPIYSVRWTVIVKGVPQCTAEPGNDVL